MKEIPTDPMAQHQRFIDAFCEDIIAGDVRESPRAKAVVEITRQMRSTRQSRNLKGGEK